MGIDIKPFFDRVEEYGAMVSSGVLILRCQGDDAGTVAIPLSEIKGVFARHDPERLMYEVCVWTGNDRTERHTTYRQWWTKREDAERTADFIMRHLSGETRIDRRLTELLQRNIKVMESSDDVRFVTEGDY